MAATTEENPILETIQRAADVIDEVGMETKKLDGLKTNEMVDDQSVPEEPSPDPQKQKPPVSDVLRQLEQLIISDEWTFKQSPSGQHQPLATQKRKRTETPKLNEATRSVITSYSLKAYIDLLSLHHRQSIASWLYGNTATTLSALFRFPQAALHCDDDSARSGICHAVRLALKVNYPDLSTNGYKQYVERPPVVYVSPALRYDITQQMASEFGLSDIIVAPKAEAPLSAIEGRLDHIALADCMEGDKKEGRVPLIVIAVVGSPVFGQNDLVSKLLELRQTHGFWLHVVGQGLATLALREPPEHFTKVLQRVDSFTLSLGQWIGVPGLHSMTLHRPIESHRIGYKEKLDMLPWWVATQYVQAPKISETVEHCYQLIRTMIKELSAYKNIEIIGITDTSDYVSKMMSNMLVPPVVLVFRYRLHTKTAEGESELVDLEYTDCLNSWLGQGLMVECPGLGLHLVELSDEYGTAFRFCPLETAALCGTSMDHLTQFSKHLAETLSIVDATVRARDSLPSIIAEYGGLKQVHIDKWAGVGGVSYIPAIVRETPREEWNEKQRQQVSYLNVELVHSLRSSDSAFSTGENEIACVKFGMLADEKDLKELVNLVAERGQEIEESSQYMESLAEMVRQGIEAANQDLRKESEQKLMNEGVLRQLPMFGSLINWWSPVSKDADVKGRTFDLKTGQIHSTEVLYKHKLQMQMNSEGDMAPMTPMTPVETSQIPHGIAPVIENGVTSQEEANIEAEKIDESKEEALPNE